MTAATGDDGSGLLSTFAGILAFLVFLLFCVQLLTGLYARSVVTDVAHAGVAAVAGARVDHGDPAAVLDAQRAAEERMRSRLGHAGRRASFDWDDSDGDEMVLRVRAPAPRFLFGGFRGRLATDEIDRTVRARVEQVR